MKYNTNAFQKSSTGQPPLIDLRGGLSGFQADRFFCGEAQSVSYRALQTLFAEFEISHVGSSIRQGDLQLPAGVCPTLVSLPDVGVDICCSIVAQATAACGDGLFDSIQWSA